MIRRSGIADNCSMVLGYFRCLNIHSLVLACRWLGEFFFLIFWVKLALILFAPTWIDADFFPCIWVLWDRLLATIQLASFRRGDKVLETRIICSLESGLDLTKQPRYWYLWYTWSNHLADLVYSSETRVSIETRILREWTRTLKKTLKGHWCQGSAIAIEIDSDRVGLNWIVNKHDSRNQVWRKMLALMAMAVAAMRVMPDLFLPITWSGAGSVESDHWTDDYHHGSEKLLDLTSICWIEVDLIKITEA